MSRAVSNKTDSLRSSLTIYVNRGDCSAQRSEGASLATPANGRRCDPSPTDPFLDSSEHAGSFPGVASDAPSDRWVS
jgi:hypothetical protein